MIVPRPLPTALPASTTPNIHAGSCDRFSANAAKNVKNPTTPRSSAIAVPAMTMLRACSAPAGRGVSPGPTRSARGMPERANGPEDEHDAAGAQHPRRAERLQDRRPRTAQRSCRASTLMIARREFASTSSSLSDDHGRDERALGDRLALREHERAERERIEQQVVDVARHQDREQRPAGIDAANSSRRPPRVRSRNGPSTGATTANGAIVISRYSSTLGRAALTAGAEEQRARERHRDEDVAGRRRSRARARAGRTA